MKSNYALITAARNEGYFIDRTIRSVLAQSVLPIRWVIVSDGSTDATDEIVKSYSQRYSFIALLRMEDGNSRNFASQAYALNRAASEVWPCSFEYIGCLDADISLEPDYYRNILDIFSQNPKLGVAGGFIYEKGEKGFTSRGLNSQRSVAGAIQMFRRECFAKIEAFTPIPHGGLDDVAVLKAKMFGFHVSSFPQLKVYHHRRTGADSGYIAGSFKAGLMDYEMGYHPIYELFCSARRVRYGIPLLCSLVRYVGFASSYLVRRDRMVSEEIMAYSRREQKKRLHAFVRWLIFRAQLDKFEF